MGTFKFALGADVTDRLTGYKGRITARCEHRDRPNTYLVESIDTTNRPIEWWLDEARLETHELF